MEFKEAFGSGAGGRGGSQDRRKVNVSASPSQLLVARWRQGRGTLLTLLTTMWYVCV